MVQFSPIQSKLHLFKRLTASMHSSGLPATTLTSPSFRAPRLQEENSTQEICGPGLPAKGDGEVVLSMLEGGRRGSHWT